MEARDTVMTFERIQEIDLKNAESNFTDALWDVAREQAEISFKARQDEIDLLHSIINSKDVAITDLKSLLELAKEFAQNERQAGIKEVVEWGLETCPHDLFGEGTQCFKRACDECWKDKIKEWG